MWVDRAAYETYSRRHLKQEYSRNIQRCLRWVCWLHGDTCLLNLLIVLCSLIKNKNKEKYRSTSNGSTKPQFQMSTLSCEINFYEMQDSIICFCHSLSHKQMGPTRRDWSYAGYMSIKKRMKTTRWKKKRDWQRWYCRWRHSRSLRDDICSDAYDSEARRRSWCYVQ